MPYRRHLSSSYCADVIAPTTEPIHNTATYKTLAETIIYTNHASSMPGSRGRREGQDGRCDLQGGKKGRIEVCIVANLSTSFAFFFFRTSSDGARPAPPPSIPVTHTLSQSGSDPCLTRSPWQERWQKLKETNPILPKFAVLHEEFLFRDRKAWNVVVGAEDHVERCNFVAVVMRVEQLKNQMIKENYKRRGQVIENARPDRRAISIRTPSS